MARSLTLAARGGEHRAGTRGLGYEPPSARLGPASFTWRWHRRCLLLLVAPEGFQEVGPVGQLPRLGSRLLSRRGWLIRGRRERARLAGHHDPQRNPSGDRDPAPLGWRHGRAYQDLRAHVGSGVPGLGPRRRAHLATRGRRATGHGAGQQDAWHAAGRAGAANRQPPQRPNRPLHPRGDGVRVAAERWTAVSLKTPRGAHGKANWTMRKTSNQGFPYGQPIRQGFPGGN